MSDEVTNGQIYGELIKISGDIGGLKTSNELFLKALENHGGRIGVLESVTNKQKGAVKVWGLVATAAATIAGVAVQLFRPHHG